MLIASLALAAFIGGVLAIASPCILPVLPFLFGAVGRPFWRWTAPMLAGLVGAFIVLVTVGTIGATWLVHAADDGRRVALLLLALVGLSLVSHRVSVLVMRPVTRLGAWLTRAADDRAERAGRSRPWLAFALGVATGFVWAPCAGPILALVVTLSVSGRTPAVTTWLLAAFGLGTATALSIALAIGGRVRRAAARWTAGDTWMRRTLGVATLAAVLAIALGLDARVLSRVRLVETAAAEETVLRRLAPNARHDVRAALGRRVAPVATPDLGPLPDFVGGTLWFNAGALPVQGTSLAAESLRGKVVVVNVWTFECFNCLNALPHVKALAAKYHDRDVVVIGVHTPELARERIPANVADAIRRLDVKYPVVFDPDYRIWQAFDNEYWPSVYIADKAGRIRFRHFGEGAYDDEDRVVAQLLAEPTVKR